MALQQAAETIAAPVDVVNFDDELADPRPQPCVDAGEHGFFGAFHVDLHEIDSPASRTTFDNVYRLQVWR